MTTVELSRDSLHASVTDPVASSMNFLNEVANRYPDAISLAAGRPYEGFYRTADITRYLDIYTRHLEDSGHGEEQVRRSLMQYGPSNGQLQPLVSRLLRTDEDIDVPDQAIAITAGCQEAMAIVLRGLFADPADVLLVSEPCYVGVTGAARLIGVPVVGVPEAAGGLDPADVTRVARAVRASGRNPRVLYLVPDFANPSGACLDVHQRRELLRVAAEEDLLVLEDNAYGLFGADDRPRPRLKSLDTDQRVIYLGSFAKSCFPGARVGFLIADQTVVGADGTRRLLAEELATVKSMLSLNTSPIAQGVIGGLLIESDCSLRRANTSKIEFYRRNLRALKDALERHLGTWSDARWNAPAGGFFMVVDIPMTADEKLLEISASEYGVLWTPMSFFYLGDGGRNSIRLSCSALSAEEIDEGVRRLAELVRDHRASLL
ncbi:(S)-3,5-dihydroxyphenylglycine transaminase [Micromonospora phaseoli]|uniref:(S)-3,5-dihydroxyphenylglycine transaminase n=1 Tax=Micromonospora phaseoli TaxID=1144548 RepID=A0A1H7DWX4_9ACTN|nr:PLP-dependent aminotransferase family protein [Micromonospora phaseoli]PZV89973.1 (S)-3,5-dihydroxyphenylglycine transaminase [Micromonospora phaseoli]GIJ78813.1 aminotransferase [Micromonospora phaseoli]SEK04212.1 (S)-3,5-dihydroxyphenylglycine transaminase [Micromonospora phaseoli]